jgi:hypothetical protein
METSFGIDVVLMVHLRLGTIRLSRVFPEMGFITLIYFRAAGDEHNKYDEDHEDLKLGRAAEHAYAWNDASIIARYASILVTTNIVTTPKIVSAMVTYEECSL